MLASPDQRGRSESLSRHNLILVRHSLPIFQSEIPASQWRLSEEGFRRAALLPQHLSPYHPTRIISSPETKAQQTAQIIASSLHLTWFIEDGLHEHERPQAAGNTSQAQFENLVADFFAHPNQLVFGSESADQAYMRFSSAIDQLITSYPQETLVIVSHGTVISLFISHKCGLEAFELWRRLGLPFIIVLSLPGFQLQHITESIQSLHEPRH